MPRSVSDRVTLQGILFSQGLAEKKNNHKFFDFTVIFKDNNVIILEIARGDCICKWTIKKPVDTIMTCVLRVFGVGYIDLASRCFQSKNGGIFAHLQLIFWSVVHNASLLQSTSPKLLTGF